MAFLAFMEVDSFPKPLMPLLLQLDNAYCQAREDHEFWNTFHYYMKHYVGRPSPLYFARRLTQALGGAKVYFKRDELNHTGAHKINNCIGQILLAQRMGKRRIIAETGAGQHGVATATVCALFDIPCVIYMGQRDIDRAKDQRLSYASAWCGRKTSHLRRTNA